MTGHPTDIRGSADNVLAQYVEMQSEAKMDHRETNQSSINNARQLRCIHFIDSKDGEFKRIMKNARSKLEIPMPAAMPCKNPINGRGETCRSIEITRPNMPLLSMPTNSMRIRLGGAPHRYHEDHTLLQKV